MGYYSSSTAAVMLTPTKGGGGRCWRWSFQRSFYRWCAFLFHFWCVCWHLVPTAATSTLAPTQASTLVPTTAPTGVPTLGSTLAPTQTSTLVPTAAPTGVPTLGSTLAPTQASTLVPTAAPTGVPTLGSTLAPTQASTLVPTAAPTGVPTLGSTLAPTQASTLVPTAAPTGVPTLGSTLAPTQASTLVPTAAPTGVPTLGSTLAPTQASTLVPTAAPTGVPTLGSTLAPTQASTLVPTAAPTGVPTLGSTLGPTQASTLVPTAAPTGVPTLGSTLAPTQASTLVPTAAPTGVPTLGSTLAPTQASTLVPTAAPTGVPTLGSTLAPTQASTLVPTAAPTGVPTLGSTPAPTQASTLVPTAAPTGVPTLGSTLAPTQASTLVPTAAPTGVPTLGSTLAPTQASTLVPTLYPTGAPTSSPTLVPATLDSTLAPTQASTLVPTAASTGVPTLGSTLAPTQASTLIPTLYPTGVPTLSPTLIPTLTSTQNPTLLPTTQRPTFSPTRKPTIAPTRKPTVAPTPDPTESPTLIPTLSPTTSAPTVEEPDEISEELEFTSISISSLSETYLSVDVNTNFNGTVYVRAVINSSTSGIAATMSFGESADVSSGISTTIWIDDLSADTAYKLFLYGVDTTGEGLSTDHYHASVQYITTFSEPPSLSYARFASTGKYIRVYFTGNTDAAEYYGLASGSFKCSKLFEFQDSASSSCSWTSAKMCDITISSTATIATGDTIELYSSRLKGECDEYCASQSWVDGGVVSIQAPSSVQNPTISLVYSDSVSSCDDIELDSSASSGGAGRALSYAWDVISPSNSGFQSYIRSANDSEVTIPNSDLSPGTTYTFVLNATNFLGGSSSKTFEVYVSSVSLPSVAIDKGSSLTMTRDDELSLYATATYSGCENVTDSSQITYSWIMQDSQGNGLDLESTSSNPRKLKLDAYSLSASTKYYAKVTASLPSGTYNTKRISVQVLDGTLEAVLAGGTKRTVQLSQGLIVSASYSLDSNSITGYAQNATYTWSCGSCSLADYIIQGAAVQNFSASILETGTTTFIVVVTDGDRSSNATQEVTVVLSQIPEVSISTDSTLVNQGDTISLVGQIILKYATGAESDWTLEDTTPGLIGDRDLQNVTSSVLTLQMYQSGTFTHNLVFDGSYLVEGAQYTLSITSSYDGSSSSSVAQIELEVNEAPFGEISVTPTTGTSIEDDFKITAEEWSDTGDHLPLKYSFHYYNEEGSSKVLRSSAYGNSYTASLPAGYDDNSTLIVKATAKDIYEASGSEKASITVKQYSISIGEAATLATTYFDELLEDYSSDEIFSSVQSFARLIEDSNSTSEEDQVELVGTLASSALSANSYVDSDADGIEAFATTIGSLAAYLPDLGEEQQLGVLNATLAAAASLSTTLEEYSETSTTEFADVVSGLLEGGATPSAAELISSVVDNLLKSMTYGVVTGQESIQVDSDSLILSSGAFDFTTVGDESTLTIESTAGSEGTAVAFGSSFEGLNDVSLSLAEFKSYSSSYYNGTANFTSPVSRIALYGSNTNSDTRRRRLSSDAGLYITVTLYNTAPVNYSLGVTPTCAVYIDGAFQSDVCAVVNYTANHTICNCTVGYLENGRRLTDFHGETLDVASTTTAIFNEISSNLMNAEALFTDPSVFLENWAIFAIVGATLLGIPLVAAVAHFLDVYLREKLEKSQESSIYKQTQRQATMVFKKTNNQDDTKIDEVEQQYTKVIIGTKNEASYVFFEKLIEGCDFLNLVTGGKSSYERAKFVLGYMTAMFTFMFWAATISPVIAADDFASSSSSTSSSSSSDPLEDIVTDLYIAMYSSFLSTPVSVILSWLFERSIDLDMPEMERGNATLQAPNRRASIVVREDSMRHMAEHLSRRRQHGTGPAPNGKKEDNNNTLYPLRAKGGAAGNAEESTYSKKQSEVEDGNIENPHNVLDQDVVGGNEFKMESESWTSGPISATASETNRYTLTPKTSVGKMIMRAQASFKGIDDGKEKVISEKLELLVDLYETEHEKLGERGQVIGNVLIRTENFLFRNCLGKAKKDDMALIRMRRNALAILELSRRLGDLREGGDPVAAEAVLLRVARAETTNPFAKRAAAWFHHAKSEVLKEERPKRRATPNRNRISTNKRTEQRKWGQHNEKHLAHELQKLRQVQTDYEYIEPTPSMLSQEKLEPELAEAREKEEVRAREEEQAMFVGEAVRDVDLARLEAAAALDRFSDDEGEGAAAEVNSADEGRPNADSPEDEAALFSAAWVCSNCAEEEAEEKPFPAVRPDHNDLRPQTSAEIAMRVTAAPDASCSPRASIGSLLDDLEFNEEEEEEDDILDELEFGKGEEDDKHRLSANQVKQRRTIGWSFFIVYNAVCAFYICLFGISYPDSVENWLSSFYIGLCQDTVFCLPVKLALFFYVLPLLCPKRLNLKKVRFLPEYSISVQLSREFPDLMASKLILASKQSIQEADDIADHGHLHNIFHGREETHTYKFLSIFVTLVKMSLFLVTLWPLGVQEFIVDNAVPAVLVYLSIGVYKVYIMSWWGKLIIYGVAVVIFLFAAYIYYVVLNNKLPAVTKNMGILCSCCKRRDKQSDGNNRRDFK